MKKYLKTTLIIMAFSIMVSTFYVKAYLSPGSYSLGSVELPANQKRYKSDYRTKINELQQQYYHTGSVTSWSGDCTDCEVGTLLYDVKLGYCNMVVTTKKQLKTFRNSELKGDYYIELYRVNPGWIKTTHGGTWYINIQRQ